MAAAFDFYAWCWRPKARRLPNESLFSLARQLSGKSEVSRDELEQAVRQIYPPRPSEQAGQQIRQHTERELRRALSEGGGDAGQGRAGDAVRADDAAYADAAKRLAELEADAARGRKSTDIPDPAGVRDISSLEEFVARLQERLAAEQRPASPAARQADALASDAAAGRKRISADAVSGATQLSSRDGLMQPADSFPRGGESPPDEDLFRGIDNRDDELPPGAVPEPAAAPARLQRMLDRISGALADHHRQERSAARHSPRRRSPEDMSAALAQLVEQAIVSPGFRDTFFVNRDAAARWLAKKSFIAMERLMNRRVLLRRGTHASGSRGRRVVLTDRVQRARSESPHLSVLHTLRRSLQRRAAAGRAPLLDQDDLVEYATRARVGCSVVLALDVSGAVQFGRRIQGVRTACLAFAYYLRRFHPSDRVRFVAYHERVREVGLADVARLRSVNGAGKDIGRCLRHCRDLLKQDRDRVPVVVLIGDGLPTRGDRAGFYRFHDNNQEFLQGALDAAADLHRRRILFTFYQFMDQRHLWRDYADDMARRIAARARGTLYRIDSPATMALSLIESYERTRASVLS